MVRVPIHLGSLELFAHAGRLSSFKLAAQSLSLTPSAISQSIRKLEDRLGCVLFLRVGNSLQLTSEGRQLLEYVERGMAEIQEGLRSIQPSSVQPLSLSSPPAIAAQLLPPVIQSMLEMDIHDIRLVADEAPDFVSYRNFDLAILYGEKAGFQPDLESLGPDVFLPVCTPAIARQLETASDVIKFPLIVNETNAVEWADWLRLNDVVATDIRRLRFNRGVQIISAMLNGLGIGLESLRVIAPQLERGELVTWSPANSKPITRELTYLHTGQNLGKHPAGKMLVRLIREACLTGPDGRRLK